MWIYCDSMTKEPDNGKPHQRLGSYYIPSAFKTNAGGRTRGCTREIWWRRRGRAPWVSRDCKSATLKNWIPFSTAEIVLLQAGEIKHGLSNEQRAPIFYPIQTVRMIQHLTEPRINSRFSTRRWSPRFSSPWYHQTLCHSQKDLSPLQLHRLSHALEHSS